MPVPMFLQLSTFKFPVIMVLHLTRVRTPGPFRPESTPLDKLLIQVTMQLAVFDTV